MNIFNKSNEFSRCHQKTARKTFRNYWEEYYPIELFHGEKVFLNREPLNKSDPNAIAVLNTNSRVVGHLKRKEAARIVPHIDHTTCIWGIVAETAYGH